MNNSYQNLLQTIIDSKQHYKRADNIKLLAVSKNRQPDEIKKLFQLGQRLFGENYCQEALLKMKILAECDIEWHFIGHIQSNKAKLISENFNWVQTVSSLKIAKKLNEYRPKDNGKLNILVQVNLNDEEQKSGIAKDNVASLCQEIDKMPRLKLRGLMAIPKKITKHELQRDNYKQLTVLFNEIKNNDDFDTLSMGMSGDFDAAIAAGSTMLRIGRALFE
jgi:hypothetical protein